MTLKTGALVLFYPFVGKPCQVHLCIPVFISLLKPISKTFPAIPFDLLLCLWGGGKKFVLQYMVYLVCKSWHG